MGFVAGILTFMVFTINFILFLIAVFVAYYGLFSEYPIKAKDVPDNESYSTISNIILSLSIFIGILSFMGCYGVATDSKLYLLMYSTTLLILMVVQFFFGYGIYTLVKSMEGDAGSKFVEIIKNQTVADTSDHFMHSFQRQYNCCGFDSYKDWLKYRSHIPGSCCGRAINLPCQPNEVSSKPPCATMLKNRMEELKMPLMYCIMGVFIVEAVLGVFTACIVIRRER